MLGPRSSVTLNASLAHSAQQLHQRSCCLRLHSVAGLGRFRGPGTRSEPLLIFHLGTASALATDCEFLKSSACRVSHPEYSSQPLPPLLLSAPIPPLPGPPCQFLAHHTGHLADLELTRHTWSPPLAPPPAGVLFPDSVWLASTPPPGLCCSVTSPVRPSSTPC